MPESTEITPRHSLKRDVHNKPIRGITRCQRNAQLGKGRAAEPASGSVRTGIAAIPTPFDGFAPILHVVIGGTRRYTTIDSEVESLQGGVNRNREKWGNRT